MNDFVINEQGHFWWHDIEIPANHFAPSEHVTGKLTVAETGTISLELDGNMPDSRERASTFASVERGREPRPIQGILKESGRHVVILDAVRNGGTFHSNRFSYEEYFATFAIVGKNAPPRRREAIKFSKFEVELKGFEAWLNAGSIIVTRSSRTLKLSNKRLPDVLYQIPSGKLILKHHLVDSRNGSPHYFKITLHEFFSFQIQFKKPSMADDVLSEWGVLQNLLILLTGTDYPLPWPSLTISRTRSMFTLFFHRLSASDTPPTSRDCPVPFSSINKSFGDIVTKWKEGVKIHGAGYFALPSTKRKMDTYVENKFSNLMYGMESLHRSKFGNQPRDSKLQAKIDSILAQVDSKQRPWLQRALQFQGEPSLKERLMKLITIIPIEFESARLDDFTKRCAALRNDIAHFGGKRTRSLTANFNLEVSRLSEALSVIYHMILLLDIGISEEIVRNWLLFGRQTHIIRYHFVEAGLLHKDELNQK
ncbi:HEPN domain-containing protein [Burkholderia gladioli]|uniref:ApeA N-terminal domain 1-containing protein n=1 Tax=Burkholderia gladioli TaxID=28095 RepID=UPI00163E4BAD|nr:HEPN domain-containing protein [Burkholderia gladioli]